MKSCLRKLIDKNGAVETVFTPTPQMIAYSILKARNRAESEERVCALTGIATSTVRMWKTKYGTYYTNWLDEALEFEVGDEAAVLERVGMMQAMQPGNYQFWRDLARTKGVIKDDVRVQNITLNTDFKTILVATGGDLESARAKILENLRGISAPEPVTVHVPAVRRDDRKS